MTENGHGKRVEEEEEGLQEGEEGLEEGGLVANGLLASAKKGVNFFFQSLI